MASESLENMSQSLSKPWSREISQEQPLTSAVSSPGHPCVRNDDMREWVGTRRSQDPSSQRAVAELEKAPSREGQACENELISK